MLYDLALLERFNALNINPPTQTEAPSVRLERIGQVMAHLDNPQRKVPTIHVTGTSGKGSVVALLESMLRHHDLKVGAYTSPHLQTPLERIQIEGRLIEPALFKLCAERTLTAPLDLRYAEGWFATAMLAFAEATCDVALVEVGSGGRFNTTNIVEPIVTVINTVGMDHIKLLGGTIEQIAWHKAGIIKPGATCITGSLPEEALPAVYTERDKAHIQLLEHRKDFQYALQQETLAGIVFDYHSQDVSLQNLECGLLGAHQAHNAAVALTALDAFARQSGLKLNEKAMRRGLASARFAGRLEVMQRDPLVLLDGAHNADKLHALSQALARLLPERKIILVLGMMTSKDVTTLTPIIRNMAWHILTTEQHTEHLRAVPAEALAELLSEPTQPISDPLEALQTALTLADEETAVVVSGSLYLVGRLRAAWHPPAAVLEARSLWPK